MTAPATVLVATNCCACGRPLTDAVSASIGMGPDCVVEHGYDTRQYSAVDRTTANYTVHAIASNTLPPDQLRAAIFHLHGMGFVALAKRIERRVGRWIAASYPTATPEELPIAEEPKIEPLPFKLTEGQERAREAVQRIKKQHGYGLCVIAGYAGSGKTSLIRALAAEHGTPTIICPTGRAAARVKEATGLRASTIHRWLYKAKEDEKTGITKFVREKLDGIVTTPSRLVLLDEASMLSPEVWKDVQGVCSQLGLKLVLVGDGFQLPPILPPNAPPFSVVSPEFAASANANRVELTEVLRQAQGSPVIRASMALRNGGGIRSLIELTRVELHQLASVTTAVHRQGGVTICHRNATRFQLNAGIRATLGIYDEMPQVGEPLLVRRNSYEVGVMNGETVPFEGWMAPPEVYERVFDRYKPCEEDTRFGATTVQKSVATISIEELHGRLTAGPKPIEIAAEKWARMNGVYVGDGLAPHLHVQFGYAYTCHAGQGSQWPHVLVVVEPSIRFNEEEGRRWVYTAITRSREMTAVYLGKV